LPILDSLAEDDVRVTVDLLNLITGTHVIEPFVSVSVDEVEVRSTQPAQVSVIITGTITETETTTETLTMINNFPPASQLSTLGAVTSSAPANDLQGLSLVAMLPFVDPYFSHPIEIRK